MKLCSGCEAINAENAGRCHGCGAYFATAAGVVGTRSPERFLLSTWVISGEPVGRSRRFRAAVWALSVVAAAGATSYYSFAGVSEARPMAVAIPAPASVPALPQPTVDSLKLAPAVEVKTIPPTGETEPVAAAVSKDMVKTIRSDTAAALPRAAASRVVPRVTHTRRADYSAAAGGATTPVGAALPAKKESR